MKSLLNNLRLDLCNVINSYDLSIDIKYYIVKDVLNEIGNNLEQWLNMPEPEVQENNNEQKEDFIESEINVPIEFDDEMKEIIELGMKVKQEKSE